ncbi:hypothetical protein RYX36_033654 [Vicia faba]
MGEKKTQSAPLVSPAESSSGDTITTHMRPPTSPPYHICEHLILSSGSEFLTRGR